MQQAVSEKRSISEKDREYVYFLRTIIQGVSHWEDLTHLRKRIVIPSRERTQIIKNSGNFFIPNIIFQ